METLLLGLLVVQGLLGGLDTLVNHELINHLPRRASAQTEVGLHASRELVYALLFAGLGWFAWHGWLAALPTALLIGEFLISTVDEYIENRTRVLPQNERVLHAFLTLNLGLLLAVCGIVAADWADYPTTLDSRAPDFFTWTLTLLGLISLLWATRDLAAWLRLRNHSSSRTPI